MRLTGGTNGQATQTDKDDEASAQERPTLKTIAFMTGLGVTTVSRALKDAPEIGAETRRRVQLVARQVGYRPNRAGVRLRTGKTNVISLVLNTEQQIMSFVSDIIYGISEVIADTPYHLIVTPYSRSQRSAGAGALRGGDRLGRRHHHLAHRSRTTRASATCWSAAFPSPRMAAPIWGSSTPITISTTTPSPPKRCASWPASAGAGWRCWRRRSGSPITATR